MIGRRIREVRNKLDLSQAELAKILGVSQRTVSHWETQRNEPPLDVLRTMCSKLGVNLNWLLTGEGEMFLNEIPQIPGIEDDERELLALLRENPEMKPLIIKLLKAAKDMETAVEEIKKISLEKKLKGGLQNV